MMQLDPLVARVRMIAAGRMVASLDQEQLAAGTGINPSTVSKIENGRRGDRATTLRAAQDVLEHVSVDVIQNGRIGHHAVDTS